MLKWLGIIGRTLWSALHIQRDLAIENLALRQQLIGSIRRACLDHVIIMGERHLKRILSSYVDYYHSARTHLFLEKDAPEGRVVHSIGKGRVVELKRVGGLHHLYARMAA